MARRQEAEPNAAPERQRLDLVLWHARVVRSRADAQELVKAGHVRLDGARVTSPAQPVKPGQVLTIALARQIRLIRILGFSERRGDANSAAALFEDITDH